MIRGLSRWRGNQTFPVTCWEASMWSKKHVSVLCQSIFDWWWKFVCVLKGLQMTFFEEGSTIMCIFQTKGLHGFTSQPLTVWTAIFPTCHHSSFHPPFTKCFRYPKVNMAIWLHFKMRGPDQPRKPTSDPDLRSRPAIQTDPDLTIQTYDPDLCFILVGHFLLQSTEKYYSVLQRTTPVLLCTTKNYSSTTKNYSSTTLYYKVLLCTKKYYSSTTLNYKELLQYYSVLQRTTPVLLCTTKYYSVLILQSTTPVLLCTTKFYSVLQSTTPVLLCTTKNYSSTTLYYKELLQYYSVLQSTILGDLVNFGKFGHPVPDLVPDRSRPVPDQFHGIQGQCPFTAMLPKKQKQVCASSAESFDSF